MPTAVGVPPYRFQVGSEWRAPRADIPVKIFLEGKLIHETAHTDKFHVTRSNSNGITIACSSVPKYSGAKKRKQLCSFVVHCVARPDCLIVKECCLDHSCLTNNAQMGEQPQRKRKQKAKTVLAGKECLPIDDSIVDPTVPLSDGEEDAIEALEETENTISSWVENLHSPSPNELLGLARSISSIRALLEKSKRENT